jgi:hypothetical protein
MLDVNILVIYKKKDGRNCKFNILTLIEKPKEVTFFENNYSKKENEDFLCLNCQAYYIIKCSICGYLFNIKSITTAYDDPELKKRN